MANPETLTTMATRHTKIKIINEQNTHQIKLKMLSDPTKTGIVFMYSQRVAVPYS